MEIDEADYSSSLFTDEQNNTIRGGKDGRAGSEDVEMLS